MNKFILNENIVIREDDFKILVGTTGDVIQLDKFGMTILVELMKNPSLEILHTTLSNIYDTTDITDEELKSWTIAFLTECESLYIGKIK